jgi:acylglycerol lipase
MASTSIRSTKGNNCTTSLQVSLNVYRGWGRSVSKPSQQGHTGSTDQVLSDITSFISTVIPSPVPLFLMGHSMGGGEVICYAASGPANIRQHIRGYLLESPFVDFNPKSKPSFITVFFGRLAGKLLPHRQLTNKLDANLICRDPEVCQRYRDDDLCHDTGTLEGLAAMLDRTALLAAGKIIVPDDAGEGGVTRIWAGHGNADGITDFGATKRLMEAMGVKDKEFKGYEGYYHRMHEEPGQDKDVFIKDVVDWIMARAVEPVQVAEGAKPKL